MVSNLLSEGTIRIGEIVVEVQVIAHVTMSNIVGPPDQEEEVQEVKYEVISDAIYGSDKENASARCTLKVEMEKNNQIWSILAYRESTI